MTITTLSSREFNQDTGKAKRAARKGPVFITDRGKPKHVLLSIHDYQKITMKDATIFDLLTMPGAGDIDFDPPRFGDESIRPADFS